MATRSGSSSRSMDRPGVRRLRPSPCLGRMPSGRPRRPRATDAVVRSPDRFGRGRPRNPVRRSRQEPRVVRRRRRRQPPRRRPSRHGRGGGRPGRVLRPATRSPRPPPPSTAPRPDTPATARLGHEPPRAPAADLRTACSATPCFDGRSPPGRRWSPPTPALRPRPDPSRSPPNRGRRLATRRLGPGFRRMRPPRIETSGPRPAARSEPIVREFSACMPSGARL